jgi:hypothetical protein
MFEFSKFNCFGHLDFGHSNLFPPQGVLRRISKPVLSMVEGFDIRISHALVLLCSCALMYFVAGCQNTNSRETKLSEQIEKLTRERNQLTYQLEQFEAENEQLKKQIQVLSGLGPEVSFENLYNLQAVKISRFTNLYDKDKDGKKEKLIVYIQPVDETGDVIKAAGSVDVQLWDLSKESSQALLGQWHVEPGQLKENWFAAFISSNYRLTFDVTDRADKFEEPLTVKVTFTDYLSGKVFEEQKVIKPR